MDLKNFSPITKRSLQNVIELRLDMSAYFLHAWPGQTDWDPAKVLIFSLVASLLIIS